MEQDTATFNSLSLDIAQSPSFTHRTRCLVLPTTASTPHRNSKLSLPAANTLCVAFRLPRKGLQQLLQFGYVHELEQGNVGRLAKLGTEENVD